MFRTACSIHFMCMINILSLNYFPNTYWLFTYSHFHLAFIPMLLLLQPSMQRLYDETDTLKWQKILPYSTKCGKTRTITDMTDKYYYKFCWQNDDET